MKEMKKLMIAFISALLLTLFIEGYNYFRGDEVIDVARGAKVFVMNFAAFYTVFFFIRKPKKVDPLGIEKLIRLKHYFSLHNLAPKTF